MIEVLLNKLEFEYDIHSLIKAFFPEQYVGVSAEKKEYDEKIDIRMQVNYGEDTIQITWQEIMHANEDAQANEKPGQEEVKEIPGETIQVDFSDRVRTKNQLVRDYSYTLRFFFQSYNHSFPVHRSVPDGTFSQKAEAPCRHPVPFCNREHILILRQHHCR